MVVPQQSVARVASGFNLHFGVQCDYQRIQVLFKWWPHGDSTKYKALSGHDQTSDPNIETIYYGSDGTSHISIYIYM